ncbi:MAG: DNA repair protein RecO [Ignavibacteria bacterium]|nr:DNA repair protein RecO [Ignavibacteria bacterium]
MPIIKTEAVVLKCDNYRETSKIITFYTKSHGKVKGIAKGVRNSKSRWGGSLQSMALVNLMFYFKETRTLHLVSNAEHTEALTNIYNDFDKMQYGYQMIELVNKTTAEYQENTKIYNLLSEALILLNISTENYVNVLFSFKFRLLNLLGFKVDLSNHLSNIENNQRNQYFYETKFTNNDVKTIEALSEWNFNLVLSLNITKTQVLLFERFFENYLRDHIENAGFSNVKKVYSSQELF